MTETKNNSDKRMISDFRLEQNHNYRYERKFTVPVHYSLTQMQNVVRVNSMLFREVFHERRVNNIYFDTPGYKYYLDNVLGVSDRKKVRIRWYGDLTGEIKKPILEIKIKNGLVGDKWSFPLKHFVMDNSLTGRKLQSILDASNLPPAIRELTKNLSPALVNSYRRQYYLSANVAYRITLDFDISYRNINPNFNNFGSIAHRDTEAVVELKYGLENDAFADGVSKQFPFRIDKKSKYITGIDCFKAFAH